MTSKARELAKIADQDGDVTVTRNLDVSSGTIKLDGNYPVGTQNVALGDSALDDASLTGGFNTAVGHGSMTSNTSGQANAGFGAYSLFDNTTGEDNTGIGLNAIRYNTIGTRNTALGRDALIYNTTASNNTAVGYQAGQSNTTGSTNVMVGGLAGYSNTVGSDNTFIGDRAGYTSTGGQNLCAGSFAGYGLTTGAGNTFVGRGVSTAAGYNITTGSKNTILGGYNGNQFGLDIRTSDNNIVLSDGDGNPRMYFGSLGNANIKNSTGGTPTVTIFNTSNSATGDIGLVTALGGNAIDTSSYQYIAGTIGGSDRMYVYGNGNVVNINNSYGALSDQKLKENIIDSGSQWDDVKALRVRKYSMIEESSDVPTQIGVIAQELEEAGMSGLVFESPDRQNEGETVKQVHYSVLYMKAVKALQEAMERIETLEAKVNSLENA